MPQVQKLCFIPPKIFFIDVNFGSEKILGLKNFWIEIFFEPIKFLVNKIFGPKKNLGLEKKFGWEKKFWRKNVWRKTCLKKNILGQNKFLVRKKSEKKLWVQRNFRNEKKVKKNLVKKNFGSKKIFRPERKILGLKKFAVQKRFEIEFFFCLELLPKNILVHKNMTPKNWVKKVWVWKKLLGLKKC